MASSAAQVAIGEPAPKPLFKPIVVNRPAREVRLPLRVVQLNARGGGGFEGILRCLELPKLAGAALILLCEADSRMARSGRREVAAELAARLGMSVAYLPEFGMERDGRIIAYLGNAILSTVPIEDASAIGMPYPAGLKWRPRSIRPLRRVGTPSGLAAAVNLGGVRISVGVAHLHSRCGPAERERQMAAYLTEFPRAGPAIFGGDLNTTTTELASVSAIVRALGRIIANPARVRWPQPYEPLFDRIREAGLEIRGANAEGRATFTFSRLAPPWLRPKLDWIALRELRPVEGSAAVVRARPSLIAPRVSDHDFVVVDLES